MRYTKEHAEDVRRRLIREGGRQIKQRGVLGAGVDGIARGLGLTGAALYTHFESKEQLLSAILSEELGVTARRLLAGQVSVENIFTRYLSLGHARAPAQGCALPAITSDIARGSDELRAAFSRGFREVVDAVDDQLSDRELALSALATAVGAVALARALPSDAEATELLAAAQKLIARSLPVSTAAASGGKKRKSRAVSASPKRSDAPARKKRS
jgi:TetR/AcrR family transcriptional repressor of nem operon